MSHYIYRVCPCHPHDKMWTMEDPYWTRYEGYPLDPTDAGCMYAWVEKTLKGTLTSPQWLFICYVHGLLMTTPAGLAHDKTRNNLIIDHEEDVVLEPEKWFREDGRPIFTEWKEEAA